MLNRITRLKRAWNLTDKLEALEEIEKLEVPEKGNGNAVFIAEPDQEQIDKYHRDETLGWKGFMNKIKNLK
jgi:hypothetical protein